MAVTLLNTIKSWFVTGAKPTETQFSDTFDSFRHKNDSVPVAEVSGLDALLLTKASQVVVDAHTALFEAKENSSNKGVASGYVPLNELAKIASTYLNIVNDLTTGGSTALASAETVKVLKGLIDGINTLLGSDNVNLDNVQELVDAIEMIQTSLSTILVNDLTTGGTTKALTAEQGKVLKGLIDGIDSLFIVGLDNANLGIGDEALDATPSTGSYNLALGTAALTDLTAGGQNTAIGHFAMYLLTVANGNVAVGASAMQNATTGSYNTAVGFHALESRVGNLTGNNNIAVGLQAGRAVTTGSNNILLENTTNDGISTGNFNIILNGRNKSGVTTGSGNVIIGGYDGTFPANMSETIVIGTGTGTQRLTISSTGLVKLVSGAPVYADNAAAISGGLVAGNIYRTATGQLMIVY